MTFRVISRGIIVYSSQDYRQAMRFYYHKRLHERARSPQGIKLKVKFTLSGKCKRLK